MTALADFLITSRWGTLFAAYLLLVTTMYFIFVLFCRAGRFLLILARGWPPEHYDDDYFPEQDYAERT